MSTAAAHASQSQHTNCNLLISGFFVTYSRTFPFGIHSETTESGAGASVTPRNGTILGCEIRLQITTSLQNTFGEGQQRLLMRGRERRIGHLCDLSHVIIPVHTEALYRDSLIAVNALPNIAVTTKGNSGLACLDEFVRYNMGNRE